MANPTQSTEPAKQGRKLYALDPEIEAMAKVDEILGKLEPDVKRRVINWMAEKHSRRIYNDSVPFPIPKASGQDTLPGEHA
jgi:hypothetical protein